MNFPELVAMELKQARKEHSKLTTHHEAYAVIKEELDEYWDEVKKKQTARRGIQMFRELIQIGAMAQRVAEDLRLVEEVKEE